MITQKLTLRLSVICLILLAFIASCGGIGESARYDRMRVIVPCDWGTEHFRDISDKDEIEYIMSKDEAPFLDAMFPEVTSIVELDLLTCESCRRMIDSINVNDVELTSAKVYFDANSGDLMKAVIEANIWNDTAYVEFTSDYAEFQLTEIGERYTRANKILHTDLFQALRSSFRASLSANKTVVMLVTWEQNNKAPLTMWIVQGIGIDPYFNVDFHDTRPFTMIEGSPDELLEYTRRRRIVSAKTGQRVKSSSAPGVDIRRPRETGRMPK